MHNLRDLDFNLLLVFDTIRRSGSVTRSAQQLGLTQGAVSHSLKRLRELFGDPLFIRGTGRLVLTERGTELAQPISEILARAQELVVTRIKFDPQNATRPVTLGLNAAGELAILPALIRRLRVDAPGCTVSALRLEVSEAANALAEGAIDLVLGGALATPGDLLQQKMYTHGYAVLTSAKSPLRSSISLEEYCALEHVSSRPHFSLKSQIDVFLAERGLSRNVIVLTDNILVLPHLLEEGRPTIATIPQFMVDHCLRSANVRTIEVIGGLPRFDVFQIWHRRYDRDNFSIWLRSFIKSVFFRHSSFNIE